MSATNLGLLAVLAVSQDGTTTTREPVAFDAMAKVLTAPDDSSSVWYSVRVSVRNDADQEKVVRVRLQGVDAEGFEILSATVRGFVPATSTVSLSERTLAKVEQVERVRNWKVQDVSASPADSSVMAGDIQFLALGAADSSGHAWYALRATVTNHTDKQLAVNVEVRGADGMGFERTSETLRGVVDPGQSRFLTDRTFARAVDLQEIVEWYCSSISSRPSSLPGFTVSRVDSTLVQAEDTMGQVWYSVRAEVRSQLDRDQQVSFEAQGVDQNGFELASVTLRGTIEAGRRATLTDKSFMDGAHFRCIAAWQVNYR